LQNRNGAHRAAISLKETHYEEDEEEDQDEEEEEESEDQDEDDEDYDEEDDEKQEGDLDEEEEQPLVEDGDTFVEQPEDFIIPPRRSIFTPIKNSFSFLYFFTHNLVSSTYTALHDFTVRLIEILIYIPLLWIVDSFRSLFQSLTYGAHRLLALLGLTPNPFGKISGLLTAIFIVALIPPSVQFILSRMDSLNQFHRPPGTYIPLNVAPNTAEEIISRLLDLEKHLSSYSSQSAHLLQENAALRQSNDDERIRRAAMDQTIYHLRQDIEGLSNHAKKASSSMNDLTLFNKDTKAGILDIQRTIMRLDNEIAKHESEIKSHHSKHDSSLSEIKTLKSNINALKGGLTTVEGQLKRISDEEYISSIALKKISEYLPSQLAVRVNPKTKRLEINPEFWTALRSVFPDRNELEKSVSSHAEKLSKTKIVQKELSWNDFLRSNEESIKGFVKVQLDDKWNKAGEDGVIVSREYFLEILKGRVNELQNEMEGKLHGLLDKFETSSKENLAKAMASADALVKKVKKTGVAGDLSSEALNSIVETALQRYSKDTLAKRDYALYSSGARVNPLLTSPKYHHPPNSLFGRVGSYVLGGAGATWGHEPQMALFQDTTVGMCWAFPGSQGGLGIRLSQPVLITDVSVEHVHREVAKNIGSAPKEWSLYGLVSDEKARAQMETVSQGLYGDEPMNLPRGYVLLVRGLYDVNHDEGRTIQTAPVPAAIRRLNIPIEQVVFTVASNWGNKDYTCLYRIRVHGEAAIEDGDRSFGDDEVV
jgi:DNA repair exonuclease SbcCD ATPase subunit